MEFETLVREVQQRTGITTHREAIDAARAVLETLFVSLPGALAQEVAAHLPCSLRFDYRAEFAPGERLTAAEFLARVDRREGVADGAAFCHAQAVFQMLGGLLGLELLERVRAELPLEYDQFWGRDPVQAHMHQPVG
ncbi:MAG: DUF2267 domain-containing protein [Armatimonadota bacterium]